MKGLSANNQAVKWAEKVINGKVLAGEYIKLACERFFNDLKNAKDLGIYLDEDQGMKITNFAGKICRHWKGVKAGQPIIFEPHQQFKYLNFHGWRKLDGTPRFFTSYKQVARKQGKTTEEAVDAILHSISGPMGGQCWVSANKEDQARILIRDAGGIINASPELKSIYTIYTNRQKPIEVTYPAKKSLIGALGQDSKTQDGFDPSKGIQDEFHEATDFSAPDVIISGMGSQPNAQFSYITTAGFNKMACYELRERSIQVLRGIKKDESLFPMIFELDEADDWHDDELWGKPNPNLGVSMFKEYLKHQYDTAILFGGEKEVNFRTKNLNQWTNASKVWIQDEKWMACGGERLTLEFFKGKECFIGLDLAKEIDLNCLSLVHLAEDGIMYVLPFFWITEEKGEDIYNKDRVDYILWRNQGHIEFTAGNVVFGSYIAHRIEEIASVVKLQAVGYDVRYANHTIIQHLQEVDYPLIQVPQKATKMTIPMNQFETLVERKMIRHGGNPILRWMLSNVELYKTPEGDTKPDKGRSRGKIDGIAATLTAFFLVFGYESETLTAADIV